MHGQNHIGFTISGLGKEIIKSVDPSKKAFINSFTQATEEEISWALHRAQEAFLCYKDFSGVQKATFLEAIAEEISKISDGLIETVTGETGLTAQRIEGEIGRTIGQIRMFATMIREGSWVDACIDTPDSMRVPPKPDVRKMLLPVGPVVVFAASNFPLAFSTAGGDTISALAGGNPVIVKAHSSHLGTNELISGAIIAAAKNTGMPDGVFSSLIGSGATLGQELVQNPIIKGVGFTGSYYAGKILHDLASKREKPIPVFAEMGSINPVIILPERLSNEIDKLAETLAGSVTLGAGQFCTNPGLLLAIESNELKEFTIKLKKKIESIDPATMLNEGIWKSYNSNKMEVVSHDGVQLETRDSPQKDDWTGSPAVASVSGISFINNPKLQQEVFGPFTLIVSCKDQAELSGVLDKIHGQLTVTFMATDNDINKYGDIIKKSHDLAGRIIFNNVPTGVEVCHAMHHGGPFPASTDCRFTSVGADAIRRFTRPVCFQNYPKKGLPVELSDNNQLGIMRRVNGQFSRAKIQ